MTKPKFEIYIADGDPDPLDAFHVLRALDVTSGNHLNNDLRPPLGITRNSKHNIKEAKMAEEETYRFKHYLLGDSVPVRVLFAESNGLKAGAMVPESQQGKLVFASNYLSLLEQSHEVEEITEGEFNRLCEEIYAKKRHVKGQRRQDYKK